MLSNHSNMASEARNDLFGFITGVRPVDGTSHEVAKQPLQVGKPYPPNGDAASFHGRISLPRYENWYQYCHLWYQWRSEWTSWLFFLDTGNRAAGDLDVSNCGHPRPLGQSGIFKNPLWGLLLVMRYNFITCNRPLVETSTSDPKGIHLPRTYRVNIWVGSLSSFLCCLCRLVTFSNMPTVQVFW